MSVGYNSPMPKQSFRKGERIMKTMIYLPESVHTRLKHMAVDNQGSISWICTGDGIDDNHLPASCR